MTSSGSVQSSPRTNPIVYLLSLVVVALLAIVVMMMFRSGGGGRPPAREPKVVAVSGEKAKREDAERPPPAPKPVKTDRLTGAAQPGKTYAMVLKGSADSRGTNRSWGETLVVYVQWVFECAIDRSIESNDGNRIVEVRHFKTVRSARVDSKIEEIGFDFGWPGELVLGCLDTVVPGSSVVLESLAPIAKELAKDQHQRFLDEQAKVSGAVDSLSGKRFRLTFENGKGVTQLEPIGCDLTDDERDFLLATAVLADCFIMPDLEGKIGAVWTVDAQNLAGLIDPSLRGQTSGSITVERKENSTAGSHQAAQLEITQGRVVIDSTTPEKYDIGTFSPRGTLLFDLEDQFVTSAELNGNISIENCSRDHILYETSFRAKPQLKITYSCGLR
jgi:hypothetical protein